MKIRIFLLLFFSSVFLGIGIANAANYVLGYSSVDDGEIRFTEDTKYGVPLAYAMSTWTMCIEI